jgi:hypothetical protein
MQYEIHITVSTLDIDKFTSTCEILNVKPIILDLQNNNGRSVIQDVMTSSKYSGLNFLSEISRITDGLKYDGFNVIRKKVETQPQEIVLDKQYLESHIRIKTPVNELSHLRTLCKSSNVHLSRNIFKRVEDGILMMATLRSHHENKNDFTNTVNTFLNNIKKVPCFTYDKVEIEQVIIDDNLSHDDIWINKI